MNTAADRTKAVAYFISMGWTPAQAAGIVANLVAESGLNPAAVGDGGQAYGIAQWHGDRQAGFAALMGKPIQGSSLEDQLAWVHAELQGTERKAGNALRACTTAADAGACVSTLYERPADLEGEATRREKLAETILQEYSGTAQEATQATPAEVPPSQPQPQPAPPEAPMGAIATFLPLIMQLIPGLAKIPGLGAVVGAATGQPAPGAPPPVFTGPAGGGSMHAADYMALAQIILDTFVKAVPQAQGNPALAVGMAQTDPAVAEKAAQAVTEHPDVVAALNAQVPVFDAIAKYDAATNAARIAGANAAAARAATDKWDMTKTLVLSSELLAVEVITFAAAGIAAAAYYGKLELALALLSTASAWVTMILKNRAQAYDYRFDGTPAANATAAVNQQIAAMNATKP